MSPPLGKFAGKVAYGSTAGTGPGPYLTTVIVKGADGSDQYMPEMSASAVTASERCILYERADGTFAVQLGGLLWIALREDVGWLVAVSDAASAARITLTGSPLGAAWQVATAAGAKDIWYSKGAHQPLNVNGGDTKAFAPQLLTPSLDAIVAAHGHPDADLADVDLRGASLASLDLTTASLAGTQLNRAAFEGATLTSAIFDGAVIGSATFDGATLDGASFQGAMLTAAAWGKPKSAKKLVLTGCKARGATLGDPAVALDCTGAAFGGADLRDADLRKLNLTGAKGAGALLAGAKLDGAILDGADISNAVAVGASFVGASLRGTVARGASLVHTTLSYADLTRAQMGARAWLFALAATYSVDLDSKPYAQPTLVTAFAGGGVTISPEDRVVVDAKGSRWQVVDAGGPYDLRLNAGGTIDVFSASPDLRPASLRGATCLQTKAPGASLAGADLRAVSWSGLSATLDHADLSDASLAGSYLAETDFTQAYLDGADLSGCVLVQAKLSGCSAGAGASERPLSLEGSLLQGTIFTGAKLTGSLLVDAAVALPRGVPLFALPLSAASQLTPQGLAQLAPLFAQAGRPLGADATVTYVQLWLLDDSANSDTTMPKTYRVEPSRGQLAVFDDLGGPALFELPASPYESMLAAATANRALCAAFTQNGYSLAANAPISTQRYWAVSSGSGGGGTGLAAYARMHVFPDAAALPVYGSPKVAARGQPLKNALAFGPTQALDTAMSGQALAPSGAPRSWVEGGLATWEQLVTAAPGMP